MSHDSVLDAKSMQLRTEAPGIHAQMFLAGSFFAAAGMVLGGGVTVLTGIVFARWLKPEGFGVYSLALVAISFLGGFGTAGMDAMVARFTAFYLGTGETQKIRAAIRFGVGCALVLSVVLAALTSLGLQMKGVSVSGLSVVGWYIVAAVPVLALQLVLQQALSGLQYVRTRVVLEKIVQPVLRLGLPFLVLVWVHDRLHASIAALTLTALLVSAAAMLLLINSTRTLSLGASDAHERRQWFGYALPFAFYALQNFVYAGMGIDVLLVGIFASVEKSGIYAAAFRFVPVLLLARAAMDYAFGPKVGVLYGEADLSGIRSLYKMSSAIGLAWTLPLGVVLGVFGQQLMGSVFGSAYAEGGTALAVLVLGFAVDGATGCNATLLGVVGRPWLVLMNGLGSGAVTVALCFGLIPSYGIIGAAFAVTAGRTVANVMTTAQIWHLHRLQPFDLSTVKILVAGIAAAALALLCRQEVLPSARPMLMLGAITFVVGAYVIVLWLLRLQRSLL